MPFIVDDNFDDVLHGMMRKAKQLAYDTNMTASVPAVLDGHAVTAVARRQVVRGRTTIICVWTVDGLHRGYNAVRGILRRGS